MSNNCNTQRIRPEIMLIGANNEDQEEEEEDDDDDDDDEAEEVTISCNHQRRAEVSSKRPPDNDNDCASTKLAAEQQQQQATTRQWSRPTTTPTATTTEGTNCNIGPSQAPEATTATAITTTTTTTTTTTVHISSRQQVPEGVAAGGGQCWWTIDAAWSASSSSPSSSSSPHSHPSALARSRACQLAAPIVESNSGRKRVSSPVANSSNWLADIIGVHQRRAKQVREMLQLKLGDNSNGEQCSMVVRRNLPPPPPPAPLFRVRVGAEAGTGAGVSQKLAVGPTNAHDPQLWLPIRLLASDKNEQPNDEPTNHPNEARSTSAPTTSDSDKRQHLVQTTTTRDRVGRGSKATIQSGLIGQLQAGDAGQREHSSGETSEPTVGVVSCGREEEKEEKAEAKHINDHNMKLEHGRQRGKLVAPTAADHHHQACGSGGASASRPDDQVATESSSLVNVDQWPTSDMQQYSTPIPLKFVGCASDQLAGENFSENLPTNGQQQQPTTNKQPLVKSIVPNIRIIIERSTKHNTKQAQQISIDKQQQQQKQQNLLPVKSLVDHKIQPEIKSPGGGGGLASCWCCQFNERNVNVENNNCTPRSSIGVCDCISEESRINMETELNQDQLGINCMPTNNHGYDFNYNTNNFRQHHKSRTRCIIIIRRRRRRSRTKTKTKTKEVEKEYSTTSNSITTTSKTSESINSNKSIVHHKQPRAISKFIYLIITSAFFLATRNSLSTIKQTSATKTISPERGDHQLSAPINQHETPNDNYLPLVLSPRAASLAASPWQRFLDAQQRLPSTARFDAYRRHMLEPLKQSAAASAASAAAIAATASAALARRGADQQHQLMIGQQYKNFSSIIPYSIVQDADDYGSASAAAGSQEDQLINELPPGASEMLAAGDLLNSPDESNYQQQQQQQHQQQQQQQQQTGFRSMGANGNNNWNHNYQDGERLESVESASKITQANGHYEQQNANDRALLPLADSNRLALPQQIKSRFNQGCVGGTKCQFFAFCWMSGGSLGASCGLLMTCCVTPSRQEIQPGFYGPVVNDPYCGRSTSKINRIVGGTDASFGQFPWQAFVQVGGSRCGGALISSRHVVTAGHCVARSQHSPSSIKVTLGDYILNSDIESIPHEVFSVVEVLLHPNFRFTPQADRYDVAVLELDRTATYKDNIKPICLPQKDAAFVGRVAFVAGWGALQAGSKLRPKVLQHVPVPVIENQVCESWHRRKGIDIRIYDEMMCAGYELGQRDACQGDSGGPLMLNQYGVWYLVGIVSAGYSCAKQHQPGIYHRVSSSSDWISSNVYQQGTSNK